MGCAPMSYVLWKDFMTVDPKVGGTGRNWGGSTPSAVQPCGLHHAMWCSPWYRSQPRSTPPCLTLMGVVFCLRSLQAPKWFNRDRFVLSAGHGSMLNYSLLHLMGYESVGVSPLGQGLDGVTFAACCARSAAKVYRAQKCAS